MIVAFAHAGTFSHKQIVVTSNMVPRAIPDIDDGLRARFEGDLAAEILSPNVEQRTAILMKKAEKQEIHLPQIVAQYIASATKSNGRSLEGTLNRINAFSRFHNRLIDLQLALEIIGL